MTNAVAVLAVAPRGSMFEHDDLVADVRAAGARIQFISDGDVAGALMAFSPDSGVDLTDGEIVRGVRYGAGAAVTDSIVMRSKPGTVRHVTATHRLDRLASYSAVDYERPTPAQVAGIHRED